MFNYLYPQDYISTIQQLSDTDKPEYFGLPANVERSLQRTTSREVISQLNTLTRPVEGVTKFDREEWQLRLAPVLNLWKKLNQSSDLIQLKIPDLVESSGAKGPLPVPAFVSKEFRGALQLVQHLHKCLAAISKVIRGSHLPSGDTLLAAERLMSQQRWNANVSQGVLLKLSLDLADLFHPDTFLCALKQQTARSDHNLGVRVSLQQTDSRLPDHNLGVRVSLQQTVRSDHNLGVRVSLQQTVRSDHSLGVRVSLQQTVREYTIPLDELGLTCSWTKNGMPAARLPVTLAGLQLEGATFNGLRLTPNTTDTPSVCAAPGCTIAWMPKGGVPVYHPDEMISLPVYFTAAREHVLVNLDVPCAGNQDKWVQTGTAFFLHA
ncbi:unnamed protein product [Timema podura]|uniref:Dynein heavy chain C-terminal domain-containing protein n=1 Tax=Timema podura TaxID=61482 RepID=A0ABN7NMJ4_TIMPD|nr:unnamed protein product [Timema podura]